MLWAALNCRVYGALEASPCIGVLVVLRFSRLVFRSLRHMAPQPLSKIRPYASTKFDPDTFLTHPGLAVYPMTVIARWARTDATLAELLSAMLKSPDVAVGMAMYQALAGGEARRAALFAAAEEALSVTDYCLFQAVVRAIKPSRDRRNDFAHHLWGTSSDVPNALLLVDPKIFVKHLTMRELLGRSTLETLNRQRETGKTLSGDLDHRKVFVFYEKDLKREVKAATEAGTYAFYLNFAVDRGRNASVIDQMRTRLLSVPAIQQAFERLSLERKKATPRKRRPKTRPAKR